MIYKTYKTSLGQEYIKVEHENGSVTCIPNDPANTDYQQFKKDIMAGGELQDADGNVMSADAAKAFVATLP